MSISMNMSMDTTGYQNSNPTSTTVDAAGGDATAASVSGGGISEAEVGSTNNANISSYKTNSVAILVGNPHKNNHHTVNVVVWACHKRTYRNSQTDPWKYTLEYYEFLEDTNSWTNLDQLLLKFGNVDGNLHIASNENNGGGSSSSSKSSAMKKSSSSSGKQCRIQKMMESLQSFLDKREEETNDNTTPHPTMSTTSCMMHLQIPAVDGNKIESSLMGLLLEDQDVQLAVRGNLQISRGLIQQGLALWLNGEGLLTVTGGGGTTTTTGTNDDEWVHSCKLQQGIMTSHLVMDRTAAQCIHLLPPPNAGVASVVGGTIHNNSLFGVLSKPCLTQFGKSKINLWLRQPLIDLQQILERQQAVADLTGLPKDSIRDALKSFTGFDINNLIQTLSTYSTTTSDGGGDEDEEGATAGNPSSFLDGYTSQSQQPSQPKSQSTKKSLQTLYQLYLLAYSKLPQLAEAATTTNVGETTGSQLLKTTILEIIKLVGELSRCCGLVEAVVDLESAPREYMLKPEYSSELQELYDEMQSIEDQLKEEHDEMESFWQENCGGGGGGGGSGKAQVRLEKVGDFDYQFRLPNTNDIKTLQSIKDNTKKIQTHRMLKNGVYFSTVGLRQLSAKYQDLDDEYTAKSKSVVQDAMKIATTYTTVVERVAEHVSTLDVLCGLAYTADYNPNGYCRPTLTDSDEDGAGIQLQEARHPCVELQEDIEYIPNDISLIFGESNFLLVTGPNMGGKSTYIRALGAIVCMAQIGSFVPCKAATINICHSILARVGAGDLQERGISTFMAEMLEASSILRMATKRSLIIVDELGRGTSTFDGYGLARAISEYIIQRIGCCTVFATHFHELTQTLPAANPGGACVQNCHVTAQKDGTGQQGLTFLYQVRPGPCLESFGIQVAEMANVPNVVIQDAKRKAEELESFVFGSGNGKNNKKSRTAGGQEKTSSGGFLERFQKMNVPSILKRDVTDNEKKMELLQLLRV